MGSLSWETRIFSSTYIASRSASTLMGRTMPVVPRMDRPFFMPRRGLKVLRAISRPPGIDTVTRAPFVPITLRTASSIILRGTGLMAGSPTGIFSPGSVIVPTPSPATNRISPSLSKTSTREMISMPLVMSGSSPLSLMTPQLPSEWEMISGAYSFPPGTVSCTRSGHFPSFCHRQQASAAAAAQLPVVKPSRFPNTIFRSCLYIRLPGSASPGGRRSPAVLAIDGCPRRSPRPRRSRGGSGRPPPSRR